MKNFKFLIFIVVILVVHGAKINAQQNTRNTVWVPGSTQTSHGWIDLRYYLVQRSGYDFENLMDINFLNAIGQGTIASGDYIHGRIGNEQDVLGIGHGFGGIALRYAQNLNNELSAMILSGVPNQGSWALDKASKTSKGNKSRIQWVAEKIETIKAVNNCHDCYATEIFKNWVDALKAGEVFLSELSPENDIIKNINKPENLPSIPYIVLYGVVDNFSLTRMMDTKTSLSDGDHLVQCYQIKVREVIKRVNDLKVRNLIELNSGFHSKSLKYLGELVKSLSTPADIISALGSYIGSNSPSILQELDKRKGIELEFSRRLECELVNKVLEAEWGLQINNNTYEEVELQVNNAQLKSECFIHCDIRYAQGLINLNECEQYCNATTNQPILVRAFKGGSTDGLLSEAEQKLPGDNLQAEIKLPNTNHLQETNFTQTTVVEAFEDIFMGNYGAAFIVPN